MSEYDDIINTKYPFKSKHPKMCMEARAAQFSSFAALSGYEDAVKEKGRITEHKISLGEDDKIYLDNIIQELENKITEEPFIVVTYFIKDMKKEGGKYDTYQGNLIRIDNVTNTIIFKDKKKIKIENIVDIKYQL